jgi:hypothetical protein
MLSDRDSPNFLVAAEAAAHKNSAAAPVLDNRGRLRKEVPATSTGARQNLAG